MAHLIAGALLGIGRERIDVIDPIDYDVGIVAVVQVHLGTELGALVLADDKGRKAGPRVFDRDFAFDVERQVVQRRDDASIGEGSLNSQDARVQR